MKIITIIGSPHKARGATARLADLVGEGAEGEGACVETIFLPGKRVNPCNACDTCHKVGKCPQKDDFEEIRQKILDADGLILGSPNYIYSVSAQLKAFIDRCCGVIHCVGFEGKYGASVVTSGGGDEEPIVNYMNHFLITTGITPVGSVWATMGLLPDGRFTEEIVARARELGRILVHSWKSKAVLPEVERVKDNFKERMKYLMVYRKQEWPYEYAFWQKHRGLT
ncbi:MAG: flavodoxin family protein [Candidatus Abyssobacteria bacterium SURF_5]|uniref:Flavodoxin family protein n=1 Tax=Abyssobacteria bacterium (strain SURF_5) TaxID=2093360 RepID=A0A3A4P5B0_ABYX5|nr:MAG: flavodoxin family protein [Candidatus Abyssubacteria bacterium SURF_5]